MYLLVSKFVFGTQFENIHLSSLYIKIQLDQKCRLIIRLLKTARIVYKKKKEITNATAQTHKKKRQKEKRKTVFLH